MLARTPAKPLATVEQIGQRIEELLASGLEGQAVAKTMELEGCEVVSLNGFVGLRLGNSTLYHPLL